MADRYQAAVALALLATLVLTIALDPRTHLYESRYDPDASPAEIASWLRDLQDVQSAPTWDWFDQPAQSPLGAPDFEGRYLFGRQRYELRIQIRGEAMHYVAKGIDDQQEGGAWFALGQGRRQGDGRWFSSWSCLDLTRAVSNGGGAWFRFGAGRQSIDVQYYHDTEPMGETPLEGGEAVLDTADDTTRMLEGRIPLRTPTVVAAFVLYGRVVDETGQGVAGAAVKRRAAGSVETVADGRGFFALPMDKVEALTLVAAGKIGFANGFVALEQETAFTKNGAIQADGNLAMATISLRRLDTQDHRDYRWVAPQPTPVGINYEPARHLQCGNCHVREYQFWSRSRHATMATNPWVRAAFELDARPAALAAGDTRDQCTPCHSPSLAAGLEQFHLSGPNLLQVSGVDAEGNHCDFCHKIEAVTDPARPGLDGSIRLLRPDPRDAQVPGSIKRVFGPLPDVSYLYMGASYNPLFQMSLLCAGCHEHEVANTPVLGQSTWSEWKASKFAAPGPQHKECQDCHMPAYQRGILQQITGPDGKSRQTVLGGDLRLIEMQNDAIEIARYGTRRRPFSEGHKHSFAGTDDLAFVKQAVRLDAALQRNGSQASLRVTLENTGAGHAMPTGHGLKRYVLVVVARKAGALVALAPELAEAERIGQAAGASAGMVLGRQFANDWQVPYWRAQAQTLDTRLQPGKPRQFEFNVGDADEIEVRLILRRGPPGLLREHGMDVDRSQAGRAEMDQLVQSWRP